MLLSLHSGFILSVLNIIHVLDLESVCLLPIIYTVIIVRIVLLLTCSVFYLLLFVDLWNVNKISISVSNLLTNCQNALSYNVKIKRILNNFTYLFKIYCLSHMS